MLVAAKHPLKVAASTELMLKSKHNHLIPSDTIKVAARIETMRRRYATEGME
jgi:hypothetical protein